ncbi:hypothetical protein [Labrys wisconsinensis]
MATFATVDIVGVDEAGPVARGAEASVSAVSWSAVIAGALAAVAASLVLLLLGSGLGLAMTSPWSGAGAGATAIVVSTAIWLVIVQWLSSALGGYLTGRLRTKWAGVHADEVFFRDTAHGFLAWALATVVAAGLLSSALTAIVGGGASAVTSIASGAAQGATQAAAGKAANGSGLPTDYFIDLMFRPPANAALPAGQAPTPQAAGDSRAEASRILLTDMASGDVPAADRAYLGQLVAQRTGLPAADAEKRISDVLGQLDQAKLKVKEAADAARKAGIATALLTVLSLLVGAFIASAAAALGGRQRDEI